MMNLKMFKNGAVGLQFNWIFVLIVGGLIFAFFFTIMQKQMETNDLETQVTVQNKLNSIMKSASENPGSLFKIGLKDVTLRKGSCSEGLYLGDNRNMRIRVDTTFSPDLIQSVRDEFYLWTLPWKMPYTVINFVYITSPDVRYIVVNDDEDYGEEIFESPRDISLPDDITKELVTETDSLDLDKNNYKIRFVEFTDDLSNYDLPNIDYDGDSDVSLVVIEPRVDGLDGYGNVSFYKYDNGWVDEGKSHYLGRPAVFGAIFSENKEIYECALRDAYTRLERVNKVYHERTRALEQIIVDPSGYSECGTIYYKASEIIYDNLDLAFEYHGHIYNDSLGDNSIKTLNRNAQLKSCPTIY